MTYYVQYTINSKHFFQIVKLGNKQHQSVTNMGQPRFVPMVMKLYYDDQYLSE